MTSVRRCRMRTACVTASSSGGSASIAANACSSWVGSAACSTTAAISSSLSAKTRKIVPSAMPGGLGDLPGRDHLAVLEQQRQHGLDDHRPALVGGQGFGRAWRSLPTVAVTAADAYVSADSLTPVGRR